MEHSLHRPGLLRFACFFQTILLVYVSLLPCLGGHGVHQKTASLSQATLQTVSLPAAAAQPTASIPAQTQKTAPPVNILLIGLDRREGETAARADSTILCTFQPDTDSLTMTSFLRDLYLEIPDRGGDRINAAYAYGGRDLLRSTVETNFDIVIDGCLEVDFSQFSRIIDTLGGVTLELRQDEADAINREIPGMLTEGSQHLNGSQALAYSRIRNLDADGDFSRTLRQRNVMTALLEHFRSITLFRALSVILDILPFVSTDLEQKQIISLALQLVPRLETLRISSLRIPEDGAFRFCTIRGMEVLQPDLPAARKALDHARTDR